MRFVFARFVNPIFTGGVIITQRAQGCHPELVEGSRVKALPTMLRQAQHDTRYKLRCSRIRTYEVLKTS
jgi:hypothetical protein